MGGADKLRDIIKRDVERHDKKTLTDSQRSAKKKFIKDTSRGRSSSRKRSRRNNNRQRQQQEQQKRLKEQQARQKLLQQKQLLQQQQNILKQTRRNRLLTFQEKQKERQVQQAQQKIQRNILIAGMVKKEKIKRFFDTIFKPNIKYSKEGSIMKKSKSTLTISPSKMQYYKNEILKNTPKLKILGNSKVSQITKRVIGGVIGTSKYTRYKLINSLTEVKGANGRRIFTHEEAKNIGNLSYDVVENLLLGAGVGAVLKGGVAGIKVSKLGLKGSKVSKITTGVLRVVKSNKAVKLSKKLKIAKIAKGIGKFGFGSMLSYDIAKTFVVDGEKAGVRKIIKLTSFTTGARLGVKIGGELKTNLPNPQIKISGKGKDISVKRVIKNLDNNFLRQIKNNRITNTRAIEVNIPNAENKEVLIKILQFQKNGKTGFIGQELSNGKVVNNFVGAGRVSNSKEFTRVISSSVKRGFFGKIKDIKVRDFLEKTNTIIKKQTPVLSTSLTSTETRLARRFNIKKLSPEDFRNLIRKELGQKGFIGKSKIPFTSKEYKEAMRISKTGLMSRVRMILAKETKQIGMKYKIGKKYKESFNIITKEATKKRLKIKKTKISFKKPNKNQLIKPKKLVKSIRTIIKNRESARGFVKSLSPLPKDKIRTININGRRIRLNPNEEIANSKVTEILTRGKFRKVLNLNKNKIKVIKEIVIRKNGKITGGKKIKIIRFEKRFIKNPQLKLQELKNPQSKLIFKNRIKKDISRKFKIYNPSSSAVSGLARETQKELILISNAKKIKSIIRNAVMLKLSSKELSSNKQKLKKTNNKIKKSEELQKNIISQIEKTSQKKSNKKKTIKEKIKEKIKKKLKQSTYTPRPPKPKEKEKKIGLFTFKLPKKFTSKTLRKSQSVFYVKEKVRGKIINLTPRPLTLRDAKDFLAHRLDNRLSRSGWFEPLGKARNVVRLPKNIRGYFRTNSKKLRPFKIRAGKKKAIRQGYIEKTKYMMDTRGERKQSKNTKRRKSKK